MKEIWKDIEGYEGLYQISNKGRVKSLYFVANNEEKIIKQQTSHKGYNVVHLSNNGERRKFAVHRLVALAFIPNVENKPCVDHINTVRTDNRVENLRWVTHKENCNNELTKEHRSKHRSKRSGYTTKKKGFVTSDEIRVKISRSMGGCKILCLTTGEVFETASEASRKYNLTPTNVLKCCKGERKSAGKINEQKLIWQYYN